MIIQPLILINIDKNLDIRMSSPIGESDTVFLYEKRS